jgi:hypothetical protein
MRNAPLMYIAGAYTNAPKKNTEIAEKISIQLIRNGFNVVTPHKNFYGYEKYNDIDYSTWLEIDFKIISRCDAIYVMSNHQTSVGTAKEIDFCKQNKIPIIYEDDFDYRVFSPGHFADVLKWYKYSQLQTIPSNSINRWE